MHWNLSLETLGLRKTCKYLKALEALKNFKKHWRLLGRKFTQHKSKLKFIILLNLLFSLKSCLSKKKKTFFGWKHFEKMLSAAFSFRQMELMELIELFFEVFWKLGN